ncbi:hypothetical protein BBJ28_00013865 [Nothophytophthora sp. Chile5]|nr:hypothetical protein BBJ28_00013865 [Nothophytophthora sp. Chile5]
MSSTLRCLLLLALLPQPTAATASAPAFVQLQWSDTSLLHVSLAESVVVAGAKRFFATELVAVLDVRGATQQAEDTNVGTFDVLFLVGDPLLAFASTATAATVDSTDLVAALGVQLEAAVQNATNSSGADATTASTNHSTVLWQDVEAFRNGSVSSRTLSSVQVLALYSVAPNFPALHSTDAPKATPFMRFSVIFGDVSRPAELPQSVVYQTRLGVARFLGEDFNLTCVVASGPAETASNSALLANQSFFLLLPANADASLLGREALANLLMFGDPTRAVDSDSANSTRPAMFSDFMFSPTELAMMLQSETFAASASFASTIFPYVFRSISFDLLPAGNPALPAAAASDDTAALLAAISEDALRALQRKRQHFQYDPEGYFAALPTNLTYPGNASGNADSGNDGFATTVYWANTLGRVFWLERVESVEPLAWNLFPATPFFLDDAASLPAAPLVQLGNSSTPLWTLQSATPDHLDLALHFRSADDNATLVKVEVAVTLHESGDAESTVTSIARAAGNTSGGSVSPLDIVVRHRSRLLLDENIKAASQLLLFLELGVADVTEKSADGCGHCQQLLEWCAGEPKCAVLQSCVLSAMQDSVSELLGTTATLNETQELSPFFDSCLGTDDTGATPVDMDALMLFTSTIRCQLQRLCAFKPSSYSSTSPSGTKLVWNSGDAQHHLEPAKGQASFPLPGDAPVNVSVRVGERVLCYLPMWSNATAASLQTKIARSCTFAKYLGTLRVNVTVDAKVATAIDIFYKGLVGPMPTLTAVVDNSTQDAAIITTISTPSIRLRLDSADGPTPFAESSDPIRAETCAECKRLALDVCLRDPMCAAYADCVLGFSTGSKTVTVETDALAASATSSLADAVLELVQGDVAGTQLSLQDGVTACHPAANGSSVSSVDVNGASWRNLVNASACFSRSLCPLSLAPVLAPSSSSVATTVGQWSVSPVKKLQRLVYTGNASSLDLLQIPLTLQRDGVDVTASSSASDPEALALALRTLIQYDDINVVQLASTNASGVAVNAFAWTVAYGHWLGALPHFMTGDSSAEWTLVEFPTTSNGSAEVIADDCILELVPRAVVNATAAA